MLRRHPLYFGGPDMPAGLSMEDRASLLEKENLLAEERDAKAREFRLESERQRKTQETELAELTKRQEAERVAAIEDQEQAAAEYSEDESEVSMADRDRKITGMWGALSASQEQNQNNTTQDLRPE